MQSGQQEEFIRSSPATHLVQVEAHIRSGLGGRVSDLRVVLRENGLALQGRARTQYARQLAQQVAMETSELPVLANEIQV